MLIYFYFMLAVSTKETTRIFIEYELLTPENRMASE